MQQYVEALFQCKGQLIYQYHIQTYLRITKQYGIDYQELLLEVKFYPFHNQYI